MSATHAEAQQLIASVTHWHHIFEIAPGIRTPGTYDPEFLFDMLGFPADMTGQTVLDIGASDGYFSLRAHRRGAKVTAVDYRPKSGHGFEVMEKIAGIQIEYHQKNIYDLSSADLGYFDHVIFLGVLYHLPDMMRALATTRALCRGKMYLETHCANEIPAQPAAARYYRASSLNNDFTNFWSPNPSCIRDMAHDCAFDLITDKTWGDRYFGAFSVAEGIPRKQKLDVAYGVIR